MVEEIGMVVVVTTSRVLLLALLLVVRRFAASSVVGLGTWRVSVPVPVAEVAVEVVVAVVAAAEAEEMVEVAVHRRLVERVFAGSRPSRESRGRLRSPSAIEDSSDFTFRGEARSGHAGDPAEASDERGGREEFRGSGAAGECGCDCYRGWFLSWFWFWGWWVARCWRC